MARGWESKSVEDQVADKEASSNAINHRAATAKHADLQRQRQALELQRERILDERTSSPVRRAALEAALADIEARIKSIS
jgi:hypothetical protein